MKFEISELTTCNKYFQNLSLILIKILTLYLKLEYNSFVLNIFKVNRKIS
jgi:hypothetical protein